MYGIDVRSLGCVPKDTVGGTSAAAAAANAEKINEYLYAEWRAGKGPLYFPAGGWLVDDTIVIALSSTRLVGAGGDASATPEDTYTADVWPNYAGPVSRLVAVNAEPGMAISPILRNRGYGPVLDGLHVPGRWAAGGLVNMIEDATPGTPRTYPFSSLLLDDATEHLYDNRPLVGIEIQGQQSTSPPTTGPTISAGKMVCPTALMVALCRVGIAAVPTPTDEHADQLNLNRFSAPYCDVGIRLANTQSVAHSIRHFDQLLCNTAFRVERGGNIQCDLLDIQGDVAQIGLHICGGDQGDDVVSGYFNFGVINVDASTVANNNDCRAVFIDPPADRAAAVVVNIDYLRLPAGRTGPVIDIKNFYGSINILGGGTFSDGMIRVVGGSANFFPTVRVFNSIFFNGHSPAPDTIFTSDSSGYVQYEQDGCTEATGFTGATNKGQIFPGFRGLLDVTSLPRTILDGGFSYHPGAIREVTGSAYQATVFDETIVKSSGAANTVTLPPASGTRGKIIYFKNYSSNNLTIAASSGDTIDLGTSYVLGGYSGIYHAATLKNVSGAWAILSLL